MKAIETPRDVSAQKSTSPRQSNKTSTRKLEFTAEVDLLDYLKTCAEKGSGDEVNLKTVVSVGLLARYLKTSNDQIDEGQFLYDVICSDETHIRFKALLDPKLNQRVQRNELRLGSTICIKRAAVMEKRCHVDDVWKNVKYLRVVDLEILGTTTKFVNLDALEEHPDWDTSLSDAIYPLHGVRRCYMDIWNDSLPVWPGRQLYDRGYLTGTCSELANLCRKAQNALQIVHDRIRSHRYDEFPVLVVRILCIRNLHFYGCSDDRKLFPYRWNLDVTDGVAACAVSVWDEAVMALYGRIMVGSIIVLTDYSAVLPRSVQHLSRFESLYVNLTWLPLEIKLNLPPLTDETFGLPVHIVFPQVDKFFQIHREVFDFKSPYEIGNMNDNCIIDIVGIITRISRYERSAKEPINGPDCGFWVHYWVEIMDASMMNITRIKLNVNSQENVHKHLEVGQAAMFVNMQLRLVNAAGMPWFLKSVIESQIILLQNDAKERYKNLRSVTDVVNSMSASTLEVLEEVGGIGGGYFYPSPLPSNVGLEVLNGDMWEAKLQKIMFWQRQEMLVKAQIVQISFVAVNMPEKPENFNYSPSEEMGSFQVYPIYANPDWCKDQVPQFLGLTLPHCNTFPRYFRHSVALSKPDWFQSYQDSAQDLTNGHTLLNTSRLRCEGYYHVTLSDSDRHVALSCFLIPCCCEGVNRTIQQRLTGEVTDIDPVYKSRGCVLKCSWEEIANCNSKQMFAYFKLIEGHDQCFLLDAFQHGNSQTELVLRRMYKAR